ncbi:probable zinc transporter protein DDB_G0282067 [Eurytemora carolleeae]|uniref:probable zinc transporter protein DDB_G0282067 n=1 Tax=Eurytemora carolleeae TaxID=1294199 RepID=UPI000C78FC9D|nr:probable zinc transporter protein DDB_G0282067 [Eurytemora carolleeae]|eukprot:XP_023322846.1 probable zinc transporter protein DDB_G0282067 [Eurytemora affinis]
MGKMSGCFTSGCGNQMKLVSMLGLTGSFMVVELVVGNTTNSMALVADSFHMLSDVIAIIIAFVSVRMSPKRWKKNTYGWARAEVVGALVNSVFLIALCFSILVEAIKRFMVIEPLKDPKLILIVGGVGLGINLVGLLIFGHHGHSHEGTAGHSHGEDDHDHAHAHLHSADKLAMEENKTRKTEKGEDVKSKQKEMSGEQMNIAGVFLHILADALGSVVVIISALVIWLTDWQYKDYLDPVLSVVIVILICISSWPLLRDSTLVLLNSIPAHIDLDKIEQELLRRTQVYRTKNTNINNNKNNYSIVKGKVKHSAL